MARIADPHAKAALIRGARKHFVRAGIRGARIEDITHASGLSKGAFYLHFESKEALFGELVAAFETKMDQILAERQRVVRDWLRSNPMTARDSLLHTPRQQALIALESKYDREILELLWNERDVFAVLSRGAQGTAFEGFIWQLAERETKRVVDSLESMKSVGACRQEVPAEVFGSLVVGSFLLIAQQMGRLSIKPDLDRWVQATQQLIRQGAEPRTAARKKRPRPVERRAS